jgi:ChrR Cupin-like domain
MEKIMSENDQMAKRPSWGYNKKKAGDGPVASKGVLMSNGQVKFEPFPYNSINDREFKFGGMENVTVPPELKFVPYQVEVRKDIDIHVIFSTLAEDEQGPDLAILKYAPGAFVALHEHMGHEMVLVLTGDYIENGVTYLPGSLILRCPGTYHTMASIGGCQILASRYIKVKQRPDLWNEFADGNDNVTEVGPVV